MEVRKRGCTSDYPKSLNDNSDALLFYLQHCDKEKLFKIARRLLIRWMNRNAPGILVTDFCENCYWFWTRRYGNGGCTGLCMNPNKVESVRGIRIENTNSCPEYYRQDILGWNDLVYGIRPNNENCLE